jgi:hypothetical protein
MYYLTPILGIDRDEAEEATLRKEILKISSYDNRLIEVNLE